MINRNNEKISLPPGKYWFYGYDGKNFDHLYDSINNYQNRVMLFSGFLESLPIYNFEGYAFDTNEHDRAIGVFYFTITKDQESGDLMWTGNPADIENLKENSTRLSYRENKKNNFIVFSNYKKKLSPVKFKIMPGRTECNSSCMFFNVCSGDREDSFFNPSYKFISGYCCKDYNFGISWISY